MNRFTLAQFLNAGGQPGIGVPSQRARDESCTSLQVQGIEVDHVVAVGLNQLAHCGGEAAVRLPLAASCGDDQ